jgi:hypothetical protein
MLFICAALIYFLQGVLAMFNVFALWNAAPIAIAYLLVYIAVKRDSKPLLSGFYAYTLAGIGLLLYVHFAWYFDWDSIKTGSSTAGIIFIILPVVAVGVGTVAGLAGWIVGRIIYRKKHAE